MDVQKDRVKGPTIFFLSIFMIYLISKVFSYMFDSVKMSYTHNVLTVVFGFVMIVPTIIFMVLFIKKKLKAKLFLHISAGAYVLSNIVSLMYPSLNGVAKIGPLPVPIFGILLAGLYWFMLNSYFKTYAEKYN